MEFFNPTVSGSLHISGTVHLESGSYSGSGANLYHISASAILGLSSSRLESGSATASISPSGGFVVNTNTTVSGTILATSTISASNFIFRDNIAPVGSSAQKIFTPYTNSLHIYAGDAGLVVRDPLDNTSLATFGKSGSFSTIGGITGSFTGSYIGVLTGSVSGGFFIGVGSGSFSGSYTGSLFGSASYAQSSSFSDSANQLLVRVKNQSGATIPKGKVVRVAGAVGDNPLVVTASNISEEESANTLGFVFEDIVSGNTGSVMTSGVLIGLNTLNFTAGQLIYLGPTGSFVSTPGIAPYHTVRLGEVLRAQPNNGSVMVRVDNGIELGEAHDVLDNSTTASYGDLLVKSGSVWTNSTSLTGSYVVTGSLTVTGSLILSGSSIFLRQASGVSGSNIFGTASYAETSSYLLNSISRMIYVSSGSGADTNDGSALRPVKTISQSLVLMGSNAGRIAIYPGTYPESVTITQANITLGSSTPSQGAETFISGTVTIAASAGSTKVRSLTATSIVHTGSANLYMDGVTINTNFNKTGNGYTEIFDSNLQGTAQSVITGSGAILISNSKDRLLYVSNSLAVLTIKDSLSTISPTIVTGTGSLFNCLIYSTASGSAAITTNIGSIIEVNNCHIFNPGGTLERVALGGVYSYDNLTFNKTNSTFGTAAPTVADFQQVRADGFTGSFAGSAILTGSLTGSFIGLLTGSFTGSHVGTLTGSFTGSLIGTATGSFTGSLTGSVFGSASFAVTSSFVNVYEGAWTSYTPVWTATTTNPVIGNGTITGAYKLIGKTCFVRGGVSMGSSTTFGSGEWIISLPFSASAADGIQMPGNLLRLGTAWYNAQLNGGRLGFTNRSAIQYQNTSGVADAITSVLPWTWASGDRFIFNGSYEIA